VTIERSAVLGAGPGGVAAAAALTRAGIKVALYNRSLERIAPLASLGGVEIEGDLGEEFVPISVMTDDIEKALFGAQLILCVTPAYGQHPLAELVAPHIKPGSAFVLASGSAGSLEVAQIFRERGIDVGDRVLLGETLSLPQSARMTSDVRVRIKLPSTVRMAAFPARNNERLSAYIGAAIKHRLTVNVLDTGINNVNFLIHPAPMLLNYAEIERADNKFSLMNEGMTPGVLRLMDAVDAEKMAVARAFALKPSSIDELYVELGSGPHVYRVKGEPFGLRDQIWSRYITEDVPYGMVLLSSLGAVAGVPTPLCDAIAITLAALEETNYLAEGRTAETLGLAGMTPSEITEFLHDGWT